jgi:sugar phosphate isomerase/epimerase
MKELSVQQYTFRPWANQEGLFPVLKKLREMGYTGLEMCCFGGFEGLQMSARELKGRLEELGMHMIGNHFTREMFTGDHAAAFDYIAQAGGKYAIYNIWGRYDTLADVREKAEYLNGLSPIAKKAGITLLYHNHAPEFAALEGKLVIDWLAEELSPDIFFEHDVFFARQQNCDVYRYLRDHADRVRTVHLKQINAAGENVDLPDGILDMAQVVRCAESATDFILEQSSFQESIPQSLARNAQFLKAL